MEIKKTKGTTLEGGPTTYEISTTCGETFEVVKQMHKWECNGALYHSIKEIKDKIEQDCIPVYDNSGTDTDVGTNTEEHEPLYAGVCPACYWLICRPNDLEPLTKLERRMLDDYGLIEPETGKPNYEYAQKEVDRALKLDNMINIE